MVLYYNNNQVRDVDIVNYLKWHKLFPNLVQTSYSELRDVLNILVTIIAYLFTFSLVAFLVLSYFLASIHDLSLFYCGIILVISGNVLAFFGN